MRLIDADALLKELGITDEKCTKCEWGDGNGFCTRSADFTDACDAICTAPTVEERKTGEWIEIPDEVFASIYKCSSCGEAPLCDEYSDYTFSPYCPNCGADMRGEQDGTS